MNPTVTPKSRIRSLFVRHSLFVVLLLFFVVLSVLYGATIPIFESPDANGHYSYIHELTEGRGLPVQGAPSGQRVTGYVASHPPLYYALCAAVTFWVPDDVDVRDWMWRNPYHAMGDPGRVGNKNFLVHTSAEQFPWRGTPLTVHIARLVSTALGVLAVVATYGIALEFFPVGASAPTGRGPDRRWLALGAAALTAFNPMFIFTTARVSNDAAVTAFGSLVVWGAVRLAVRGLSRRGLALTGAALGLAALSKLSGVTLGPAVALAFLFDVLQQRQETGFCRSAYDKTRFLRQLLTNAAILFGATALVCGWWFLRNLFLYGELMGVDAWLSHTATVRPEPIGFFDVIPQLHGLEMSYWAMFGWFNVSVAGWMYRVWWFLVRAGLLGLIVFLIEQWTSRRATRSAQMGLLILASAFLLIFGSVWRFIMIVLGSQGRYLMPVVAPISIFLMLGLSRLVPIRWRSGLAALVGGGHLALALISLFVFILPAYAVPETIQESQLPAEMERLDLIFDGTPIQLLGGHIEVEEAHPGKPAPVSLYWRAQGPPQEDLIAFVQLLGRDMEPITGMDGYPGGGNFPPTLWKSDAIYRDRYVLSPASNAEAPTIAALHAGLHARGEGHLSARRSPDQPPLDLALLDLVPLRPLEPLSDDVTHPVGARLGEAITLVGYDLGPHPNPPPRGEGTEDATSPTTGVDATSPPLGGTEGGVRSGEPFTITLVWRAEATPDADYTVFVHLIDENGVLVAQEDHPPLEGEYRTSFWISGDVLRDLYHLTVDEALSPCHCTLMVGMYHSETGERLPAYDGLGVRFENDAIIAGRVTIP
jgi:hypothetical protein